MLLLKLHSHFGFWKVHLWRATAQTFDEREMLTCNYSFHVSNRCNCTFTPKAVKYAKSMNSSKRNAVKNIYSSYLPCAYVYWDSRRRETSAFKLAGGHLQPKSRVELFSTLIYSLTALKLSLNRFIAPIALSRMSNRKWMAIISQNSLWLCCERTVTVACMSDGPASMTS